MLKLTKKKTLEKLLKRIIKNYFKVYKVSINTTFQESLVHSNTYTPQSVLIFSNTIIQFSLRV